MSNPDPEKDIQPIWCEKCNQQGYIFMDDPEQPAFVVCTRCGIETSQIWCPKCQMGWDFVKNIANRPTSWICDGCGKSYSLPPFFYENPVRLYLEDELPPNILERIRPKRAKKSPQFNLFIIAIPMIILLFVFRHQPWPLVYTTVISIVLLIIVGYFLIRKDNPFYNPDPRILIPVFIWLLLLIGEAYLMVKGTLLLAMCGIAVQAISTAAMGFYIAFRNQKNVKENFMDNFLFNFEHWTLTTRD